MEEEELQLAEEYENERPPEEDGDYEEWLNKTYQMVHDKEILLQHQRVMNKESNHTRIEARHRKRE